ncbi:phage baseplate assembly protein V [Paenibacillus hubeiensis]|uniref:phage baseplate assembly protein V n=1 Tax=Paenibacillus hubeiensis TaxID=3077330 RepID=UPI0031BB085F
MADIRAIISSMLKVGICSTSNEDAGTITATFPDKDDMVSGPLTVVYFGGLGKRRGVPQPGDTVFCAFLGNGLSDGVCFGNLYDVEDPPGEKGQEGVYFEDGSHVYFDSTTGSLAVKTAGNVSIEAVGTSINGDVIINGNLTVTGTVSASNID